MVSDALDIPTATQAHSKKNQARTKKKVNLMEKSNRVTLHDSFLYYPKPRTPQGMNTLQYGLLRHW